MTTTNITNRWVDLAEICTHLDVEPSQLQAASRRHYRWAGVNEIEFYLDGGKLGNLLIHKRGKYQAARYSIR